MMKIMKKVVLYVLTGILLGPFACLQVSNTAECSTGGNLEVVVDFGLQRWSDDRAYCTFPELTVTEKLPNSIKTIQISYSGEDTTNAEITLPAMAGFTASTDNTSTLVTFTTTEAASSVQEFLRNVQYKCNSSQSISILLSSSEIPNDTHYYPGTGHFYKYVTSQELLAKESMTWLEAYNAALKSQFGGWNGYLATVTSEGENNFIYKYSNLSGDGVGWLGGTRATLNNINTDHASYNNINNEFWYWACGPELVFTPDNSNWSTNKEVTKEESENGTYGGPDINNSVFFNRATHNSTPRFSGIIHYNFEAWRREADGITYHEPNNSGTEYVLTTLSGLTSWNDSGGASTQPACIIEYGDRLWGNSTPLAGSVIVSTNITKQTTLTAPAQNAVFDPGATVTVSGAGAPGYTVNITKDSEILATTQVDLDGYWSVPLINLPGATHTVSVIQSDPYGSAFPAVPLSFKILKIPTLDLFDIILTEDLTYNGAIKQFKVTLKPGVTGMGTFTVHYFRVNPDGTETELDGPPTDVGRYRAFLYIEKGTDYTDAVLRIVYFPKT